MLPLRPGFRGAGLRGSSDCPLAAAIKMANRKQCLFIFVSPSALVAQHGGEKRQTFFGGHGPAPQKSQAIAREALSVTFSAACAKLRNEPKNRNSRQVEERSDIWPIFVQAVTTDGMRSSHVTGTIG